MTSRSFIIDGADHTGFTVASLQDALAFWHGLLGLPIKYQVHDIDFGAEPNIVGVANAKVNVALLSLSNGHDIELLEYTSPEDRVETKPKSSDVGSVHVALNVKGSEELIREGGKLGWTATINPPKKLKRGDGHLWSICYIRSLDGITVELMEKLD